MVPAATAAPQTSLRFVRRRSLTLVSLDFVVGMVSGCPRRFAPNPYVPAGMRGGISRPYRRRHGQTIRNRRAAVPDVGYSEPATALEGAEDPLRRWPSRRETDVRSNREKIFRCCQERDAVQNGAELAP